MKDIKYIIYKITNKVNNKMYVGLHKTKNLDDGYMGSGKLIRKSIKKYGVENFEKKILFVFDSLDEAQNMERHIVNEKFLTNENTYNLTLGGGSGWYYVNKEDKILERVSKRKERERKNKYSDGWSLESSKKRKETKIKKYGVDHHMKNENIKEKRHNTNLDRYGYKETFQKDNKNIWAKIKNTKVEKYGVDHHMKTAEYKQKVKHTSFEKYGVESYSKTEECKQKVKEKCLEKYGVTHISHLEETKIKQKNTCIEKYGKEFYAQTKESRENHSSSIRGRIWIKNVNDNTFKQIKLSEYDKMNKEIWIKSNSPMNEKIQKCEYCDRDIKGPNFKRWHGDKCKLNKRSGDK